MSTPRLPWDDDLPEEPGIGNRESAVETPGITDQEPGTGHRDPGTGEEQPGTGQEQPGVGSRHSAVQSPGPSAAGGSSDPPGRSAAAGARAGSSTADRRPPTAGPWHTAIHGTALARLAAVRRQVLAHRTGRIRVVAPTHEHAHDVVRFALADTSASLGVARAGWVGYSVRLATPALVARALTPVSPLGFEAIVARVVSRARGDGALVHFGDASRHPGFVPCLARTLTEVRLAGLPATVLDDGTPKGQDMARLLTAVERSMADLGHADRAEVLALAAHAVEQGDGDELTSALALVDPPLASRRDVRLARALLARSRDALLTAPDGDRWVGRLIESIGRGVDVIDAADVATVPTALRRVHDGLFEPSDAAREAAEGDASVDTLSAPGEGRECVEVARAILAHAELGTPFDRIAVVMRAPELYASHLETALRRGGIPAWFGRGTRRPDPAGRAMLALLACAAEGLSARRIAEYLSLAQVPPLGVGGDDRSGEGPLGERALPTPAAEAEALGLTVEAEVAGDAGDEAETSVTDVTTGARRSPWRWESILNDAQVIGGAARWARRLRGHREQLHLRAEAAYDDDPSSPRHEGLRRHVGWADELIAFADDVIGDMAAWPATDDWGGWLARLRVLAPRVLVRPQRVLATLAELQPLAGVSEVGIAEVHDVLRDRLAALPVPPPVHRYGRVFVGTPDQVRARSFDVVCVVGLSERVFPQRSRQDPLLLDAERARLSPDLATDDDRVMHERLQLRLAAGAASRAVLASYASMDTAQSRPRVPSFYAIDLQRAVTGRVPGYEALIRQAQQRSGARLAWPAPADASTAIDAAEHDLSVLQRYLRGPDTDLLGRARYLFELNPALRRALLSRYHRLSRPWSAHDGVVADPALLERHRLPARAYSASALQRFASCPYQFYLSTILRLEPREEAAPIATLDPLTRGSMVHEMLAGIMRALIDGGLAPLPESRVADAHAIAEAIVMRVAAEYEDRLCPPIQRVWDDAVAAIRRDVHVWVGRLPDDAGSWTPTRVEIGVGFPGGLGRDEASRREDVRLPDGTRLHGVVDLLERGDGDTWRITDYKTGRHRLASTAVVNGGRTLQPVLYAMAVEAAFGGQVTASRLYYCTEDGGFDVHPWPVTGTTGEATRRAGLEVLAIIDHAIENGRLPAAPDEDACTWCDFRAVCGPAAQDLPRRKDRKALEELTVLRRMK